MNFVILGVLQEIHYHLMVQFTNDSSWFDFGALFLCVGYYMIVIKHEIYFIIGFVNIMLFIQLFFLSYVS
jgi:hypothetical protein